MSQMRILSNSVNKYLYDTAHIGSKAHQPCPDAVYHSLVWFLNVQVMAITHGHFKHVVNQLSVSTCGDGLSKTAGAGWIGGWGHREIVKVKVDIYRRTYLNGGCAYWTSLTHYASLELFTGERTIVLERVIIEINLNVWEVHFNGFKGIALSSRLSLREGNGGGKGEREELPQ